MSSGAVNDDWAASEAADEMETALVDTASTCDGTAFIPDADLSRKLDMLYLKDFASCIAPVPWLSLVT